MADKKITELTNITGANLVDADEFVVVDISADETKAITLGELKEAFDSGSGFVRITGDTMTGDLALSGADVTFGDNDKAIFGAGSDLQIYSDGTTGQITGNVNITGTLTSDGLTVEATSGGSTGVIRSAAGSNSALYLDTQDTSSVSYITASGSLGIATGSGTPERMRITQAGLVGIGTSSPSYKADILSTNQYALRLNTTDADGCFLAIQTNGTAKGYLGSSHHLVVGTPSEDDITLRAENNLQFATGGGSERMRIDSSGNVGIGTSSPTSKLTVNDANGIAIRVGDIASAPVSQTAVYIGASTSALSGGNGDLVLIPRTSDSRSILFYTGSGTAAERMRIDASGNVGIGTSSPVNNSNRTTLGLQGVWGGQLDIMVGSTVHAQFGTDNFSSGQSARIQSQDGIVFKTNGNNERMRIDSSGNLLVGKTVLDFGATAGQEFRSDGRVFIGSPDGAFVNRIGSDGSIIGFRKDGTTVGSIGTSGVDLTIGTGDVGLKFNDASNRIDPWNVTTNTSVDGAFDLGKTDRRFKDLYLSGGVYLGGTGSANKLDDYETGYHQTTIQMGSGSATANSTNDLLYYTIIGNMCFITGNIGINSVSSPSGTLSFTVPFAIETSLSKTSERAAGTVHLNGFSSENGSGIGFIETGSAVYVKTYARNNPVPTGACEMHINIFYPIA